SADPGTAVWRIDEVKLFPAEAAVVSDSPGKKETARDAGAPANEIVAKIVAVIEEARNEIIVVSPYFIPTRVAVEFVKGLTSRGVRVRILTNSLASTDVAIAHAAYARYRSDLLAAGCEIYELRPDASRRGEDDDQ